MSRSRALREAAQRRLSAALLFALAAALLVLAGHLPGRLDLTAEQQFSLAPATRQLLARLEDRLQVKFYFNREVEGAEALLPARLQLQDFLAEVEAAGRGRVAVETVDPTTSVGARSAADAAGITPIPVPRGSLQGVGEVLVYQGIELRYQDRTEVLPVLVPGEVEFAFAAAVDALVREKRPVIGFFSREPAMPPMLPDVVPQVPAGRIFEALRMRLGQRYAVRDVELGAAEPALDDLAALVVARPTGLSEVELFELDQYLAAGGHVLILHDAEEVDPRTTTAAPIDTGLDAWLARLGLRVMPQLLWDHESGFPFPVPAPPVQLPGGREVPGGTRPVNYGLWPVVQDAGFAPGHVVSQGLANVVFLWAHGMVLEGVPDGLEAEVIAATSPRTGLLSGDIELEPYLENLEKLDRQAAFGAEPRSYALVASLRGAFPSAFAGRPAPREGREVVSAAAPGLLVVCADGDLFSNNGIDLASDELGPGGNTQFALNLIDWLSSEEGLIGLRVRGAQPRRLVSFGREHLAALGGLDGELEPAERLRRVSEADAHERRMRRSIGWANVLGPPVLVLLLGLAHLAFHRRRASRPYAPRSGEGAA